MLAYRPMPAYVTTSAPAALPAALYEARIDALKSAAGCDWVVVYGDREHVADLTFLTNFLFNCWISDMETCYKAFRADIIKNIPLESNDFRIEPEITAKILLRKHRIYEVPVSYIGRTYEEGKKMKPSQGFWAIWALFKYRFFA